MSLRYLFKQSIYVLLLFAPFESASPLGSLEPSLEDAITSTTDSQAQDETSEDTTAYFKEYKYGTWSYYSATPVTVDHHLEKIAEGLDPQLYWLFEDSWRARTKQDKLRHLSPLDEEYETLKNEITKEYQELNRLSNCHYESALINILEYVEPAHIPKELSWRFGVLLGIYGTLLKETALWNPNQPQENFELKPAENTKILEFYKISLLLFSYYLGLTERSPAILQHASLDDIVSHPEFIMKLDVDFQKELYSVDETAWIQAMQSLDQQRLEHICGLFRSMYSHFLQKKETLPKSYLSLAAHLCSLTTKLLLSAQRNPVYNLDAANPWMFKLYIDLRKWEAFQMQDEALAAPDLETLLPEVKKRCLKLLPHGFTLEDITAENEYAICDEVRMRNLLPANQGDVKKGEEIIDEFEFSPVATRWALLGLLHFFDVRARFVRGYNTCSR